MSLSLAGIDAFALSPRPRSQRTATSSGLAALLRPARLEVWVGADGSGRLRQPESGEVFKGSLLAAPPRPSPWRVDRLDDRAGRGRHFTTHDSDSAPAFISSEAMLGGRPAIRTVAMDRSGFILRFDWIVRRPFAMFAVVEGSGANKVISESINRMDDPLPDLANIIDFATSSATGNPVPVAFQNGNGTPGTTPLVAGAVHIVAAIYATDETSVRVDGAEEGYEAGLTNGFVADSLSLLNNPTVRHGQNRWHGAFGEYLLISGPLDGPRIGAIERHLALRWGLDLRA
jgi:hypothetical protein